jgi:hypothetical protein
MIDEAVRSVPRRERAMLAAANPGGQEPAENQSVQARVLGQLASSVTNSPPNLAAASATAYITREI